MVLRGFITLSAAGGTYLSVSLLIGAVSVRYQGPIAVSWWLGLAEVPPCPSRCQCWQRCHAPGCAVQPGNAESATHGGADNSNEVLI